MLGRKDQAGWDLQMLSRSVSYTTKFKFYIYFIILISKNRN